MSAVIYTPHYTQFLDANGLPLNAGKLYTYAAGTTTPKATYTAADGLTANANPIILDSSGRATLFLSGSYKFTLKDSLGNLIKETDNITAFSTQSSTVDNIISNFTEDVIVAGDSVIFSDVSDGGATKRDTVQGILDLVPAVSRSGCSLYQTTGTTIPNDLTALTTILFDTESYDDDAWHDLTTNTGRITANYTGRIYLMGRVNFNNNGANVRTVAIKKNGTVVGYTESITAGGGSTLFGKNVPPPIVDEFDCVSGDYFELCALSNAAATATMTGVSGTVFKAHRIK